MEYAQNRPDDAPEGFWHYSEKRANRVVTFIENFCKHPKTSTGVKAGDAFKLLDWQRDEVIKPLFGTMRYSEEQERYVRQYQMAWIEIARKQGKTTIASAIAIYMTGFDGEESAEVYLVAIDRDQAAVAFNAARDIIKKSPMLDKEFTIIDSRKRIIHRKTNSIMEVLSADADGALGKNPSCVIYDEAAFAPNGGLWSALRTGMGARREPLFLAITTAAYTSKKFGYEKHTYAEQVVANPVFDPNQFVFLRNTPMDADWTDEANWAYANPSLGASVSIEFYRTEAKTAQNQPTLQNDFRVFYLNQWVAQSNRWIDMGDWAASGRAGGHVREEDLLGRECYGGLDLSSTQDSSSWVLVFPGSPTDADAPGYTLLVRTWLPRGAIEKRNNMQNLLELWGNEQWLNITDGDRIDYDAIEKQILDDASKFKVQMIGYDKWNSHQMIQHLEAADMTCVQIEQTVARLNDATREFERLVVKQSLFHGNNPLLAWHVENVSIVNNGEGLIKPSKKMSAEKIDTVAAAVNALAVAMLPKKQKQSVGFIPF